MAIWGWVAVFALSASTAVVLATALVYQKTLRNRIPISSLLSFAVGTLLASAFLGLLPEALESGSNRPVLATVLAGVLLFFSLERCLIWRHCHGQQCAIHSVTGPLIVIGDGFHNFVDGVVIASAFMTSVPTGITASIAVIAHEIPQEIGDFAILTGAGYTAKRAVLMNCLSSATTPMGALFAYFLLGSIREFLPYVLALSAASFLYIGTADLIPNIQRKAHFSNTAAQFVSVFVGVGLIAILKVAFSQ